MLIPNALSHLSLRELVPTPDLFTHESYLHGQAHVSRVMVHAFRLIEATGFSDEAVRDIPWAMELSGGYTRESYGMIAESVRRLVVEVCGL